MAATEMEFRLLGPFEVRRGGKVIPVRAGKQQAVLAALLLNAGRVVSVEELAEALWGPAPPPSARVTVQNYVKRLRQALGGTGGSRIITRPRGYLIRVQPGELDLARFAGLLGDALAASRDGSWDTAAARAGAALALWRGEPLAEVGSEVLAAREVPRLEDLRLQGLETRIGADLQLGGHAEVISELRQLSGAHPLREHLHALLMLALYRDGQQAAALSVYQAARQLFIEELGIEPGPELRDLHQQMLTADPGLRLSQRPATAGRSVRRDAGIAPGQEAPNAGQFPPLTPRELPAAVRYFAGRRAELDALTGLLNQAKGAPGTVVISAIGGTAGVGKTALAVYWAHQVAERFPDGQLYVNLRGFDPSGEPVEPATAVRGFLDALGVAAERVPANPQAQAGLYRSLLADKRVLIVLDNARDENQVRHLLPASPGCLVVVTSRTPLAAMVAAEGAMPITLDVLTEPEAHQLLAQRLGEGRVSAEPAAVTELINLCARLPLALAVAAARAAAFPGFRLSALATELRDAHTRLTALDAVDPAASVQAVFCWSYQQLSPSAARMFRLLAVHPGPDITVAAAVSLADAPPPLTRRFLAELVRSSMVIEHTPGRFAFHDLLRAYAKDQNRHCSATAETSAAVHRTLDHYLHTAHHADRLLGASRVTITVTMPTDGVTPEDLPDNDCAMAWFRAEHDVLMAVVRLAAEHKFDTHAWQIPWALVRYLDWTGNWHEWAATQHTALAAAERLGDQAGQAHAHRFLGDAHARLGSRHDTRTHLSQARELYHQIGDRVGEAHSCIRLAMTAELEGDFADALSHARKALDLYTASGDRSGQAHALNAVGWCHVLLGDFAQALGYCRRALDLHREFANKYGQAATWDSLGYAHHHLGDHSQAITCYQQAIDLHSTVGNRCDQAEVLGRMAETHHAAGDTQTARDLWHQALAILDELHSPGASRIRARLAAQDPGGSR